MDNFLKGAVFGAAVALVGAYLLGTDKGKETCKKVMNEVDKLKNEITSKIDETFSDSQQSNSEPEVEKT